MSDYISKSGLAEVVIDAFCGDCTQCGGHCRHDDLVEIIEHLPTVDEKEIIRKPFERVVERLEEEPTAVRTNCETNVAYDIGIYKAISIVKEECGISE